MAEIEGNQPDEEIEYIVLQLPISDLPATIRLDESNWVESGKKGWMYRLDPERPEIKQQRHVHIAKEKHTTAKDKQASWNADGTRHDKKSFNEKVGNTAAVREIARDALELGPEVVLEWLEPSDRQVLTEGQDATSVPLARSILFANSVPPAD